MNTHVRRIAAAMLATMLVCGLVPATALGETPSGNADSQAADQAAEQKTDQTPEQKAEQKAVFESASIGYKVRHGKKWTSVASDGARAGDAKTTVSGLRLNKLSIKTSTGKSSSTDYTLQVYTGKAWKDAKPNVNFTSSKALEAIKIKLGDSLSSAFDIYYRVNVKNFGWLGWAKNGASAGTTKQGLAIRAVQVKVLKKKSTAPAQGKLAAFVAKPTVSYALRLAGNKSSFKSLKKNGATAGKVNYDSKATRLKASVTSKISGSILYKVRTGSNNKKGWSGWMKNGAAAGKGSKTVQAVKFKLTGDLAKYYNVYYRAYSGDLHWLGWTKNGKVAGTSAIDYPLGAVQVVLVAKGNGAPGSTKGAHKKKSVKVSADQLAMMRKVQKYSSSTGYLVVVDRAACKTAVFTGSKNSWSPKYFWTCTVGASSTPTIKGQFTQSGYRAYSFGEKKGYSCYYATQIYDDYLFHSVLYYPYTNSIMDGTLGAHASHGCIRLNINNAKWIYDNIKRGTKIVIY